MQQLSMFDEKEEYQPRFQAYLKYSGKTSAQEVFIGDYMAWISKHIKKYRQINKISMYQRLNDKQNEEFTQYLFEVKKEC